MQALAQKGYVRKPTLLQNQAEVDNLESQIFSNQDSLAKLQAQQEQSYIKLRQSLAQMISNGLVFAVTMFTSVRWFPMTVKASLKVILCFC